MNRLRPWRWLAARRAAKRRGSELAPPQSHELDREPLPPLVSPDDDREFLDPHHPPALEPKTSC